MAYCKVWYCTSPGHWVKAKAVKWASAANRWHTSKGVWYRHTTKWDRHCPIVKPTVGAAAAVSVIVGHKAIFRATASHYDTLTWQYYNKHTWINIADHDTSHTTSALTIGHNGYYFRLTATNAWGITYGKYSVLTVRNPPKPVILITVGSHQVKFFDNFHFTAKVTGSVTSQSWQVKKGNGAWGYVGKPGLIMNGRLDDANMTKWRWRYMAKNAYGTSYSAEMHISIVQGLKPWVGHVNDVSMHASGAFEFYCHIYGATHIQWEHKLAGGAWSFWPGRTGEHAKGTFDTRTMNGMQVKVRASNSHGAIFSNTATFHVV